MDSLPSPYDPIHHGVRHLDQRLSMTLQPSACDAPDTQGTEIVPETKINGIQSPSSKTPRRSVNTSTGDSDPSALTSSQAEEVVRLLRQSLFLGSSAASNSKEFVRGPLSTTSPSSASFPRSTSDSADSDSAALSQMSTRDAPASSRARQNLSSEVNEDPPSVGHPAEPHAPTNTNTSACQAAASMTVSRTQSAVLDAVKSAPSAILSAIRDSKHPEEMLDQQLFSSQKLPTYRILEDTSSIDPASLSSVYLNRLFGLHGQVAIVTGAARGIGLALARGLAMAGARVCMADVNFEQVAGESAQLNQELKQSEVTFPLAVDVTKRESIMKMFTTTVERYGLLTICVNNAGLAISGEDPKRNYSESFLEEDFDLTINLNLKAVFFCCQFAARWMIANSVPGSIINVASMSAKVVNWPQRQSVYNASKAAVVQLTKCLAVEWCSYGIRVNSISPGYIDTPLNRQISIAHLRHEWTKKTPQHRLGDPKDLVAVVIYLASGRASAFTTGEDIVIDGGYTLW